MSAFPSILPVRRLQLKSTEKQGFSLVEVAMALGIIAVAFVSLLGLLPAGMGVFRESRDSANETWIFQSLQGSIQAADWRNFVKPSFANNIYKYDVEGKLLTEVSDPNGGTTGSQVGLAEMYRARVLKEPLKRPGKLTEDTPDSYTVTIVLVTVSNKKALEAFEAMTPGTTLTNVPKLPGLRARSFVLTKLDSRKDT